MNGKQKDAQRSGCSLHKELDGVTRQDSHTLHWGLNLRPGHEGILDHPPHAWSDDLHFTSCHWPIETLRYLVQLICCRYVSKQTNTDSNVTNVPTKETDNLNNNERVRKHARPSTHILQFLHTRMRNLITDWTMIMKSISSSGRKSRQHRSEWNVLICAQRRYFIRKVSLLSWQGVKLVSHLIRHLMFVC